MLAYHDDPAVKTKYIARVRAHRLADELIQGTGWEDGKGCAVGCTLDGYDHSRYPDELGIPLQLAYLEDQLFELQSAARSRSWPERFLAAVRPGADLARVWGDWSYWMLLDPTHGMLQYAAGNRQVESAIAQVSSLYAPSRIDAMPAARAAQAAEEAAAWARATATAWVNAACDKLIALLEAA